MALPVMNLLAEFMYSIYGSGIILAVVIIGLLALLVMSLKGDLAVMMAVLIPVAVGLVLNTAGSNFVEFPPWVLISFFMIAGGVFSVVIFFFLK